MPVVFETGSSIKVTVTGPLITTAGLPVGDVGQAYGFTLTAVNGTAPYTWTKTTDSGSGLTLTTGGILQGTPGTAGTYALSVQVTDALGNSSSAGFTLNVITLPAITTASLPGVVVDTPYSTTLAASGGLAPLTWSITTQSDTWASINGSTGVLSGTPLGSDTDSLTIKVTDALGNSASKPFTILISPAVPQNLQAVGVNEAQIDLTWNAVSDLNFLKYHVYRGGVSLAFPTTNSMADTSGALQPGTSYTYTVAEVNESNIEGAQSASATGTTFPSTGNTLYHGQVFTVTGTGFGTPSVFTPITCARGQSGVGNLDPGINGAFAGAGGNYDMQNQATTFTQNGWTPGGSDPFVSAIMVGGVDLPSSQSDAASIYINYTAPGVTGGVYPIFACYSYQCHSGWNFNSFTGPNTATGSCVQGATTITVPSIPTGVVAGLYVTDSAGALPGCVIKSIAGSTITLESDDGTGNPISILSTQASDTFTFGTDDNFKTQVFGQGVGPFPADSYYTAFNTFSPNALCTTQPTCLMTTDAVAYGAWKMVDNTGNTDCSYQYAAYNPIGSGYIFRETNAIITTQSTGAWVENEIYGGVLLNSINYQQTTDTAVNFPQRNHVFGIAYSRNRGVNNMIGVSNLTFGVGAAGDLAFWHMYLGDQPTLAASRIRAYQLPSAVSNTSATAKCWQDKFTIGQTVYAHIVNNAGTVLNNVAPGPFTIVAQPAAFNYFISPTGSNSNPGTLASPWALTAINAMQSTYGGTRVGIIGDQGSYDVSGLMNTTYHTPVLNVNGGPNSSTKTYIASCNSSGVYVRGLATITANGNGFYGGGNANISSMIGCGIEVNRPANWGNWIIDGIKLTGFSLWAVHFGNYDGGGGQVPNATLQNCEITGGNAQSTTVSSGVNLGPIIMYAHTNCTVTNNYVHDNSGWTDANHFSAMYIWGLNGASSGVQVTYNHFVNTGNIHSKEATQYNSTVAYNYIDMTNKTPSGGSTQNYAGIFGFNADGGAGTLTSIHHNIIVNAFCYISLTNDTGQFGWTTPVQIYNNTFVATANQAAGAVFCTNAFETTAGSHVISGWNNLYADEGFTPASTYSYTTFNLDFSTKWDYNIYGGHNLYGTVPSGTQSSSGFVGYSSLAAWQSATGVDAHSTSTTTNPFTNNGAFQLQYQVQSGSTAYQTGRVGGVSTGAACNVGAWDGTVTEIGCSFVT